MGTPSRRVAPDPSSITGRLLLLSHRRRRPAAQLSALVPLAVAWVLLFTWWAAVMLVGVAVWQVATAVRHLSVRSSGRAVPPSRWPVPRALFLAG